MITKFASHWRRLCMLPVLAWAAPVFADHALNMPQGVTVLSTEIYKLHMQIFWWCVAIAIVVFGVMIYSIVTFRKSKGAVADVQLTHSHKVEVVWTIVPILILVIMAIPAAKTLIQIEDTRNTELSIKVTGYQWKWHYDYLDKGVSFFSQLAQTSNAARQLGSGIDPKTVDHYLLDVDHPLVVPEDTKVRLLLTANDVIHAWWVPDFALKKDAIPGFVNEAWFKVDPGKTGLYRGQCAELCGRDHGFMPIVVEVKSKEDFAAWLEQQKAAQQPAQPATAASGATNPVTVAQTP
ncbi:MAG TPA: cytochrome c oxidase subunit II [Steroidobacteraceae bacterium]|jgi:cytochrome c oxidase subunit 2